jgi:hypothetical protein
MVTFPLVFHPAHSWIAIGVPSRMMPSLQVESRVELKWFLLVVWWHIGYFSFFLDGRLREESLCEV